MSDDIHVNGIDHIVLNVSDIEASLSFYCGELGLQPLRVEQWRNKEIGFPSVRINEGTIIDLAAGPRDGENLNHFCLVIDPVDLDAIIQSERFNLKSGPNVRFGARGLGHSIYVRDPDSNVIELRYYE